VKAKTNYDKGDYDWMIKLSIATKVTTILAFDLFMKLQFLSKYIIRNFSHRMPKPFTTITIAFVVVGVCGEIDNKFELLLVDGNILEDIQIVSI
jgi:hypothetical protein